MTDSSSLASGLEPRIGSKLRDHAALNCRAGVVAVAVAVSVVVALEVALAITVAVALVQYQSWFECEC